MKSIGKRAFDLTLSTIFLIFTSPFMLVIAAAIWLDSPGPILYKGKRIGLGGAEFSIYKFRTMVNDPDSSGPAVTGKKDQRVTRVGKVLRNLKLDEIPQLLNVIKGEMSLVGPRPEDPKYVAHYTPEQRRVLSIHPGIASPAAVKFRHEESILANVPPDQLDRVYLEQILPEKLALDLEYLANRTFTADIGILCRAVFSVLGSR